MKAIVNAPNLINVNESVYSHILEGHGKFLNDSIPVEGWNWDGNAFFSASGFQPPLNLTGNDSRPFDTDCSEGRCTNYYSLPYDFFGFGQDATADYALNECTVYHEVLNGYAYFAFQFF